MLRKNNQIYDFDLLKDNIFWIVKKDGHQIELHIHPHWLDAIYDNENKVWDLSNDSQLSVSIHWTQLIRRKSLILPIMNLMTSLNPMMRIANNLFPGWEPLSTTI